LIEDDAGHFLHSSASRSGEPIGVGDLRFGALQEKLGPRNRPAWKLRVSFRAAAISVFKRMLSCIEGRKRPACRSGARLQGIDRKRRHKNFLDVEFPRQASAWSSKRDKIGNGRFDGTGRLESGIGFFL